MSCCRAPRLPPITQPVQTCAACRRDLREEITTELKRIRSTIRASGFVKVTVACPCGRSGTQRVWVTR